MSGACVVVLRTVFTIHKQKLLVIRCDKFMRVIRTLITAV